MTTKTTAAMTAGTVGLPRATAIAAALTFIAFPSVATLPFTAATTALTWAAIATRATLPALMPTAARRTTGGIRGGRRACIPRGALPFVT